MRSLRTMAILAVAAVLSLVAADKKGPPTGRVGNWNVGLEAIAYLDKEEIKKVIGSDIGPNIVVVEITLTPKSGKELKVFADDFQLRSYKDGQKSGPFAPSQIAGKGGLSLATVRGGGGTMADNSGPSFGGLGGGRPGRLPGNGGGAGNVSEPTAIEATAKDSSKEQDNPLLAVLKEKGLPEKETASPIKGLLYFPLDGKHKGKDIALAYNGPAGKLVLEFH